MSKTNNLSFVYFCFGWHFFGSGEKYKFLPKKFSSPSLFKMILIGFIFSVIDAAGKPPADLLDGDINWLGDYEECLAIHSNLTFNSSVTLNPVPAFNGEYCLVGIPLNVPPNPVSKCEEIHE